MTGRLCCSSILILGACLVQGLAQMDPIPRELGSFPLSHAAFVEVYEDGPTVIGGDFEDVLTLYLTTFDAGKYAARLSK